MRSKLKLEPSIVIATLALFVALGGTSYAISNTINGSLLKNRSVAGKKLKKHTVTGTEVKVSTFPKVPAAHKADLATNATNSASLGGFASSKWQRKCLPGAVAAYAYVKGSPTFSAAYTSANPPVQDQFNCTGGVVQVKRTAAGVYVVHFGGLDNGQELIAVGNQSVTPNGTAVNGGELSFKLIFDATVNGGTGGTVYQVRLDNTNANTVDNEFSFALLSPQ
jgi:hypothetical protein